MQAETYEAISLQSEHDPAMHHHEDSGWKPANGIERTLSTVAADAVMGIGFALILNGLYLLRRPATLRHGFIWGVAGFLVFFVAPGLGLPPDLPGTAAAELSGRQQWWIGTVLATASGLALLFLQKNWYGRILGLALLLFSHIVGAPQPAVASSLAPESLQTQFRLATFFCNAAFWVSLGVISALLFRRFCREKAA